jgi:hypothetical protein
MFLEHLPSDVPINQAYKCAKIAQLLAVELCWQCRLISAQTSIHLFSPRTYQSKMGTYNIGRMTSVPSSVQPLAAGWYIGRKMGCAFEGLWFDSEVGNALCLCRT